MYNAQVQTYVLKVNINCCKACPVKLKKQLLKIDGVLSVEVDPEKTLASVTGQVDPMHLIKKIKKKIGKKAELLEKKNTDDDNNMAPPIEFSEDEGTRGATYSPIDEGMPPMNNYYDDYQNYPMPSSAFPPSAPPPPPLYGYNDPRMMNAKYGGDPQLRPPPRGSYDPKMPPPAAGYGYDFRPPKCCHYI